MQYQTFPDVKGSSDSLAKLSALRLPELKDKVFLDIGCNEGYFVGYALYSQASRAVGIDLSKKSILKAQKRFPEAELYVQNWNVLPTGPFDVITMLSALHYADDQEALIHSLMENLAEGGVLVLEVSISSKNKNEWIAVERSIDTCLFPTRVKLANILNKYAWKIIGKSVKQAGDPLQRYVVHVRKHKPYVYLLMGKPGSGKTTLARHLFEKAGVKVIKGDVIYKKVADGKYPVSKTLYSAISENFDTTRINEATRKIIDLKLFDEMIDLWVELAGEQEFVIDSYVPKAFHEQVKIFLLKRGFFPVFIDWDNGEDFISLGASINNANSYADFLATNKLPDYFRASVKRLKVSSAFKRKFKFNLDGPVDGEILEENSSIMVFSGWFVNLDRERVNCELYCKSEGLKKNIDLSVCRKDVVSHLMSNNLEKERIAIDEKCGFKFKLSIADFSKGVEIGVMVEDKSVPLFLVGMTSLKSIDVKKKGGV